MKGSEWHAGVPTSKSQNRWLRLTVRIGQRWRAWVCRCAVLEMHGYTDGALLPLNESVDVECFLHVRRMEASIGLSTPKDGFVNFAALV